jgi:hypothetical protein
MNADKIATITVARGPRKGEEFDLYPNDRVTVGRSEENTICIPDMTISRNHAEFSVEGTDVYFIQKKPENHSSVNGEEINDGRPRLLGNNSNIAIGPCVFILSLPGAEGMDENAASFDGGDGSGDSPNGFTRQIGADDGSPAGDGKSSGLFKSPVSKAIVVILILIGSLYLLLPGEDRKEETPGSAKEAAEKDSLVLAVRIPAAVFNGEIPTDEMRTARSLLTAAEKLYSEKMIRSMNISESIARWQQAIDLMGKYSQRTAAFDSAVVDIKSAKIELHQRYRELAKSVRIAQSQKDYEKANADVQRILQSIPDPRDWRYKWAKNIELKISDKLTEKPNDGSEN